LLYFLFFEKKLSKRQVANDLSQAG
jgi:hypothetical protein